MQFYLDKENDIWVVANDGTLLCPSSGSARIAIEGGEGMPRGDAERLYGPLIPLVPDANRCTNRLAPGITCEYEKCDGGTHRAELADGTVVEWVTWS